MVWSQYVYTKRCDLAENHKHANSPKVGRKKQWTERIQLPLAEGTTARIDSMLANGEVRLDFIRAAIEREIKRRQREKKLAP
jgi:cytochrome c5